MKVVTRLTASPALLSRRSHQGLERWPELGFTLIEQLLVVAILSVLVAIAAPSWLHFLSHRSLIAAQDTIFQTMRLSQSRAEQTRMLWQVSVRTDADGFVQVSAHPADAQPEQVVWKDLEPGIQLHPMEMTLQQSGGLYRVRFDHHGRVHGQLGRVTLIRNNNLQTKYCVTVSTLMGAVRKGCPVP